MEIKTIRTLNLIACILFGIFGSLTPIFFIFIFGFSFFLSEIPWFFNVCVLISLIWLVVVLFITFKLYQNTVIGIDIKNWALVKRWTIIGLVLGILFGGSITFILFLISFILLDDAIKRTEYPLGYPPYPAYPYYYPQQYYHYYQHYQYPYPYPSQYPPQAQQQPASGPYVQPYYPPSYQPPHPYPHPTQDPYASPYPHNQQQESPESRPIKPKIEYNKKMPPKKLRSHKTSKTIPKKKSKKK